MSFGRQRGRFHPLRNAKRTIVPAPNPNDPQSPEHAERSRETVKDLGNGIVRIDIGEPVGPLGVR